ncbi:MAG: hypothetical protein CML55_09540 [Rhodobacteraceae bacterium]|nr:hypothetical protein [Paracoccaceae bacterium]
MKRLLSCLIALCIAGSATAQDKAFALAVPPVLQRTGLLDHILPRFSLKTGITVTLDHGAVAYLGDTGTPVFSQPDRIWHLSESDDPEVERFREWLLSAVGQSAIESYEATGKPRFSAVAAAPETVERAALTGDALAGKRLSLALCGRCHVVADENRMQAIGSSPSFALMRTFTDWRERFEIFYVLRPHAPFTRIAGVTEPFDPSRPTHIEPVDVTLDELDAIIAYTATLPPADLGAPIQFQ